MAKRVESIVEGRPPPPKKKAKREVRVSLKSPDERDD